MLFELSMECESLARSEAVNAAESLAGPSKSVSGGPGTLVLDTGADPAALLSRLALCHHVSEWLGSCPAEDLDALIEDVSAPGPIRVRSTRVGDLHREVDLNSLTRRAGAVLGRTSGVDLHRPASEVRFVVSEDVHFGRLLGSVDRRALESRKNQHLPFKRPVSLHPKFARALVNLARVPAGGSLLDPFCGTGAIVAEASLMGLKAVGTDMSDEMLEGAARNLAHVGADAVLEMCDVGSIRSVIGSVDAVVTDPPYGRATSTKGEPLDRLYARSFRTFADVLGRGRRLTMAVPDISVLDSAEGFRAVETHQLWVHRSLTRNFCVLERS